MHPTFPLVKFSFSTPPHHLQSPSNLKPLQILHFLPLSTYSNTHIIITKSYFCHCYYFHFFLDFSVVIMAHRPLLHELLKEDQEPFHLKTHIATKRSEFPTKTLQLRKTRPIIHEIPTKTTNLRKHACFFSFNASPDARRSPFLELPSPAKSPCKSPNAAVFLHIPSRTAALLVEAAMRIQKQQHSKSKPHVKTGIGLLGSFLKRLADRSKNRKRAIGDSDIVRGCKENESEKEKVEESVWMSCSCSNRRLSSADWTEINDDNKSLDFEASTSSRVSELSEVICGDFCLGEDSCFCSSPFKFSLRRSPSPSGRCTPEFLSPVTSPERRVKQENANCETQDSDNMQVEDEEEKEQCSPVSVLDPPFDEDDGRDEGEDDDFDMECSYENVQRAKQQLMYRLRRFEKLAELDPVELERKLVEGSDDEGHVEGEDSDGDEPLSPFRQHNVETFVSQVFRSHSRSMSTDMKRLVSDLIVEEKKQMIQMGASEVVMGRICNRLDSWREVEFDTMIGLDFKKEFEVWTKFGEQFQDTATEIELAISVLLVEELIDDLLSTQEMEMVSC